MKRFNLVLLVVSMLVFSIAAFASDQDFILVNNTGLTIDAFYCSLNNTDDWEEDVLGKDVLPDGESVEITFSSDTEECLWDLMIVDEDGDKIYWQDIDLCKAATITLYYENNKPTANIEEIAAGKQDFILINETGLTIDEFYCSPNNIDNWEEDVLGKDVLLDGESVEITFSTDTEECLWDLLIVDEDGDKVYWQDINLCEAAKITLFYENGKPTATIEKAE
jgi:hypothetical protein